MWYPVGSLRLTSQPGFEPGMLFFECRSKYVDSPRQLFTYEISDQKSGPEQKHRNVPVWAILGQYSERPSANLSSGVYSLFQQPLYQQLVVPRWGNGWSAGWSSFDLLLPTACPCTSALRQIRSGFSLPIAHLAPHQKRQEQSNPDPSEHTAQRHTNRTFKRAYRFSLKSDYLLLRRPN